MKSAALLALLLAMTAHAERSEVATSESDSAPVTASQEDSFDSFKMVAFVNQQCPGKWGTTVRIGGHLVQVGKMARTIIRSGGENMWTANFLDDSLNRQLENTVKDRMTKNSSCYATSGEYMRYENIGGSALKIIRATFGIYGKQYLPDRSYYDIDDATWALYDQCSPASEMSKAALSKQVLIINGKPTVFDQSTIGDIRSQILEAMLITKKPKTCADIKVINEELVAGLARADIALRSAIAKAGYNVN